jgi:hypothetical protein
MPRQNNIQFRKGTLSQWIANNAQILASGEPAFEVDTLRLKIGDGTTAWSELNYVGLAGTGTSGYLPKFNSSQGVTNSLIYDNGTNVGIGTNPSTYKLTVAGSGRYIAPSATGSLEVLNIDGGFAGFNGANDANTEYSIRFDGCSFNTTVGVVQRIGAKIGMLKNGSWNEAAGGVGTLGNLVFYTNNGTIASPSLTEKMRITSDGNVGIGTSSPSSKLHVAGDVLATGFFIAGSGSAANPSFEFTGDIDTGLFSPETNTIAVSTSGVERLRVNDIGNVGIGTSPQAGFKLDVAGSTIIRGSVQSNNIFLGYATDYSAVRYQFSNSLAGGGANRSWVCNGGGTFGVGFTAPSGLVAISGGASIGSNYNLTPPTNGLIVEGNVGIGTTSPTANLHVNGSGLFSSGLNTNGLNNFKDITLLGKNDIPAWNQNALYNKTDVVKFENQYYTSLLNFTTQCPMGSVPENWYCCNDHIYGAPTAADCPGGADGIYSNSFSPTGYKPGWALLGSGDLTVQNAYSYNLYNHNNITSSKITVNDLLVKEGVIRVNNSFLNTFNMTINSSGINIVDTAANKTVKHISSVSLPATTILSNTSWTPGFLISIWETQANVSVGDLVLFTNFDYPVYNGIYKVETPIPSTSFGNVRFVRASGFTNGTVLTNGISVNVTNNNKKFILNKDIAGTSTVGSSNLYYTLDNGQSVIKIEANKDVTFAEGVYAKEKYFKIQHPDPDSKYSSLQYGSLESPYHGVRLTGKDKLKNGICEILLPDYLKYLIHEEDVSIQLTNYGHHKMLYVDKIDLKNNKFIIKGYRSKSGGPFNFYWSFTGIRKDVPKLIPEQ